jgi:hypothetical protein
VPKLNQIVAIENSVKSTAHQRFTALYQLLQKAAPLSGLSRTYQPRTEEGEQLPPEQTRVQVRVEETLEQASEILTELFDVTATKEWANCQARADVVVDGQVLLEGAPVTYLLFLEKKLVELHTFVSKLPILDQAETWQRDTAQNCWATPPTETVRTKKVPRTLVKAEATEHHPAQVEVWYEDIPVGTWRQIKYSGAMEATRVRELTRRVEQLQAAVKFAREEANSIEAPPMKTGKRLFDFLFGP